MNNICLKISALLLGGVIMLSSVAVQSGEGDSAQSIAETTSAVSSDSSLVTSSAPEVPQGAPVELGRFYHYDDERYPPERAPYLELLEGGKAIFMVNSGMGLGTAEGSYEVSGDLLTVNIDSLDIEEIFWGSNLSGIKFSVINSENLQYSGEAYGLTKAGNVFTLEGAQIVEVQPPPPVSSVPVESSSEVQSIPVSDVSLPVDSQAQSEAVASDVSQSSSVVSSVPVESEGGGGGFPMIIVFIGAGVVLLGAAAFVFFVLLPKMRKKKEGAAEETSEGDKDVSEVIKEKSRKASKEEAIAKKEAAKAKKAAAAKEKAAAKARAQEEKIAKQMAQAEEEAARAKDKLQQAAEKAEDAKKHADAAAAAKAAADAALQSAAKQAAQEAEDAVLNGKS